MEKEKMLGFVLNQWKTGIWRIFPLENTLKNLNPRSIEIPSLIEEEIKKKSLNSKILFYKKYDPIDYVPFQNEKNNIFRVIYLEGVKLTRYQDPLCDQSLMKYKINQIWKYTDLIDILRKLRKYAKKFLMKNQSDFQHLVVDSVLKFSMECDFRLALLLLSSIPQSNYYGAFICSISFSLLELEKKICTPISFQDTRELKAPTFIQPLSYTIIGEMETDQLNLNILSNLQFILSCTRVSTRIRSSSSSFISNENEVTDEKTIEKRDFIEEISCFFGDWIQRANKKEMILKKKKKQLEKKTKKIRKNEEINRIFKPHYLNKSGILCPLNFPSESSTKLTKKMLETVSQPNLGEKRILGSSIERINLEVDSQLDDSGTLMSMIIAEDFSVKMLTKQMIKFSLLLCSDSDDSFSNGFIWNEFIPHYKCKNFKLSEGATKILVEPNAGGNSYHSEILSFELMKRIFNAKLENTEMEIEYNPYYSKKTDYSCVISNSVFGVSVTRAMKFGADDDFNIDDAAFLLKKKLYGILISTKNVVEEQKWTRQILHIWCATKKIATIIQFVWKLFKNQDHMYHHLTGNTIIMCTIADVAPYIFHGRESLPEVF